MTSYADPVPLMLLLIMGPVNRRWLVWEAVGVLTPTGQRIVVGAFFRGRCGCRSLHWGLHAGQPSLQRKPLLISGLGLDSLGMFASSA